MHVAVDTLGHLLVVIATLANDQGRAVVSALAELARDYERLAETLVGLHVVAFAILIAHWFVSFMAYSS